LAFLHGERVAWPNEKKLSHDSGKR
jgi:hypothetical protein